MNDSIIYHPPVHHDNNLVMAVDQQGFYLGWVDQADTRIDTLVEFSPPNQDPHWQWDKSTRGWIRCWFVDANNRLTHDKSLAVTLANSAPKSSDYRWNNTSQTWVDSVPLNTVISGNRDTALRMVDQILSYETGTDKLYRKNQQELAAHLVDYYTSKNMSKTATAYMNLAVYLNIISDPNISADDARAAYIQFSIGIQNILL